MINFTKVEFIKSSPDITFRPEVLLSEVLFVGKSNVGKSSLINALTGRKSLAYVSSKPGHTLLLNYYKIDDKFYLVDAPGYGYTASGSRHASNFGKMMETYFDNEQLKLVLFLIDSRHEPSKDDVEFYNFVKENNIPFVIVLTKGDKLNQSERYKAVKSVNTNFVGEEYVLTSVTNNKSIETLRGVIAKYVE
ncbi:MAG: ribosome biogenesis GTP-binding protein YihA/YsxC [Bacilli bacterium]|nr:ribosome biogenesis GTP-binding protein YihA/YsxC [Bacilli bacterium]